MRKIRVCLEEMRTYEFDLEVPQNASTNDIRELAEAAFQADAKAQSEVQHRELAAIDGVCV